MLTKEFNCMLNWKQEDDNITSWICYFYFNPLSVSEKRLNISYLNTHFFLACSGFNILLYITYDENSTLFAKYIKYQNFLCSLKAASLMDLHLVGDKILFNFTI